MIDITHGSGFDLLPTLKGKVDLIFTSPPYNIGSKSARKDGQRKQGKYDPKSYGAITGYADELDERDYQAEQVKFLRLCAKALKADGTLVYNHKPRRRDGRMIHPMVWMNRVKSLTLMEEVIWDRGSTHNHSNRMFWPTTERLYVFRRTTGSYRLKNHNELQFRSDLWRVPLTAKPADGHAAPFTERLATAVVHAFAAPGDLVCDPYSGSGTTAVAAMRRGCRFIGAELDQRYHQNSLRRVQLDGQGVVYITRRA